MSETSSMKEIAKLVQGYDIELRDALQSSRSGLFKNSDGELYVKKNVPLGNKYRDEVIGIFADVADLEFFYKIYLKQAD